jgi:hypothetical protein
MIYKTTRLKKVKKYGRNQSKRNMRGGFLEDGKWAFGFPILAVVSVVVFVILVALGIILRSGGGGRKTQ